MTQTIVEMVFGSHLYGTQTPSSDFDYKSVNIPPMRDILLSRVSHVTQNNTKPSGNQGKNTNSDVDRESFSLTKYFDLLTQGQTVALDMLFANEQAITQSSPEWKWIQANREKLLSKQCQSYIGYCRTQANKYGIKGSRMAAAEKAADFFRNLSTTARVFDFEGQLLKHFDGTAHVEFVDISNPAGASVTHLSVCGKKVPFTQSVKEAYNVFDHLYQEYGKRAEAAKNNEGIDWKALSHAVRVGAQSVELLNTHFITFPRPDAAHLTKIKTGQLPFAQVAEEIEELLELVEKASETSTLPDRPDREWMDDLVVNTYKQAI